MRHVITLEICGEMWQVELVPVETVDGDYFADWPNRSLLVVNDPNPAQLVANALTAHESIRAQPEEAREERTSNVSLFAGFGPKLPLLPNDPTTDGQF
jgi:hypothetical protein